MVKFKRLFPTRDEWRADRNSYLLCAVSGLFGGIIFRQNWMGVFAWVALVPYFIALGRFRTTKQIVWGTYIFGFIWYYLSLWWLHTLTVFSNIIPLAVPALAVIEATYFLAFAFPANFAMRRLPARLTPWVLALMWPGMEYLRNWTDLAFPWNFLGHATCTKQDQSFASAFSRTFDELCEYGGVYLLSALKAFCSINIALIIFSDWRRKLLHLAALGAVFAGCILASALNGRQLMKWYGRFHESTAECPELRIAIVQPGTPQTDKWNAVMGQPTDTPDQYRQRFESTDRKMRDDTLRLVHQAGSSEIKPQLYVLPETTFLSPYFVYQTDLHRDLGALAQGLNADIFFGADNRVPLAAYIDEQRRPGHTSATLPLMPVQVNDKGETVPQWEKEPDMVNFNSAWMVTPEHGLQPAAYNKLQLVPFGEMVPFIGHFQWFQRLAIAGSFYPGLDAPIFESHGVRFGSVICFESAFPSLTSALARKGAQMICVLTNDAWYDPKYLIDHGGFWGTLFKLPFLRGLAAAGPDQHFAHSVFRAIETRLPIVRSANTGISAVISPSGEIERSLPYSSSGQFVADVVVTSRPSPTFYVRHGDWFAWLGLVVLIGHLAWMVWLYRNGNKPPRTQVAKDNTV